MGETVQRHGLDLAAREMAIRVLDVLTVGVIIADRQARRLYSNAEAHRLLDGRGGALHVICGNRIGAAAQETQKVIYETIAGIYARNGEAESHHILAIAAESGRPDLAVCISAVDPAGASYGEGCGDLAAMILLRAVERECNVEIEGRRLFGLTRMEAKFASAVASGHSLAEAARLHAVGLETARYHMKNIFRKTGVCRQSQVAALMRGAQIPVRMAPAAPDGPQTRRYASGLGAPI